MNFEYLRQFRETCQVPAFAENDEADFETTPSRPFRLDRQGVDAPFEQVAQRLVDEPVALDTA